MYPSLSEFLHPLQPQTLVNFYQFVDWLFLGLVISWIAEFMNVAQKQNYAILLVEKGVSWIDTLCISLEL